MGRRLLVVVGLLGAFTVPLWAQMALHYSRTHFGVPGDQLVTKGYTRYEATPVGGATLGPTSPTAATVGTSRALCFDANAETIFTQYEVPSDWDGSSDITLRIEWFPESGAAMADTETVKWDISYRSIAVGEAVTNGTVETGTATYTQSGAGTDVQTITSTITLAYDSANQPLTAGDHIYINLLRDFTTDTYASDACLFQWMMVYTSVGLATGGAA